MLATVRSSEDIYIYDGHFAPCAFRPIRVVPFQYTSLRFTLYDRIRRFTKAFWAFSKSQNRFPSLVPIIASKSYVFDTSKYRLLPSRYWPPNTGLVS